MYTLYQHKNKINGKIYIGITSRLPQERWGQNGGNYCSSPHFYSAIKKYGWDNFEHNILLENLTRDEASIKEKEYIKLFHSNEREYGYNETSGGEINFELSIEARKKKSKAMLGNLNGKHPCSEATKKKISKALKDKKFSEEHKEKLRIAARNRKSPHCSEEKKDKLRNNYPNMKKVYCKETDTVYKSVQECARELNLYATNISAVCRGKHSTCKGYHLTYYTDNI